MNKRILWFIPLAVMLMISTFLVHSASANSSLPPTGGGYPPPTPGAPVYFSVEPIAVDPLIDSNASINVLEIPASPSPLGQNFTVEIHLRNATIANVPAGVVGVCVDVDFINILSYCKPVGFTNMIGQPGGLFADIYATYGCNGLYDAYEGPVDTAHYDQATQYATVVVIGDYYHNASAVWNGNDGLMALITFQITGQPSKALNQTDFYSQLQITVADVIDATIIRKYSGNEAVFEQVPYSIVQGTLKIDDPTTIPGDLNGDGKVSLQDLVLLANAYGSEPGDAKWNLNADINGNGIVDTADLLTLALHYGLHYP